VYLQAVIFIISYTLPVSGRHLWSITHPGVGEVSQKSYRFLDLTNGGFPWKFADISFLSWYPSYIWSVSRYFEFVWTWNIILRHLRHQKTCAWASLAVSENRIRNSNPFRRYRGAAFAPPVSPPPRGLRYKNLAAVRGLKLTDWCMQSQVMWYNWVARCRYLLSVRAERGGDAHSYTVQDEHQRDECVRARSNDQRPIPRGAKRPRWACL